jgi:hypothetical protein
MPSRRGQGVNNVALFGVDVYLLQIKSVFSGSDQQYCEEEYNKFPLALLSLAFLFCQLRFSQDCR